MQLIIPPERIMPGQRPIGRNQQMYIADIFSHGSVSGYSESILMDHLYPDMLAVNTRDDIEDGGKSLTDYGSCPVQRNGLYDEENEML